MGRTTDEQLPRPIFRTSTGQYPELVTVREGGLEPPRPIRALAPQASASAISAIRAHPAVLRRTTDV